MLLQAHVKLYFNRISISFMFPVETSANLTDSSWIHLRLGILLWTNSYTFCFACNRRREEIRIHHFFFSHRGFYGFQLKCWWRYYCSGVTRIPAFAEGIAEWEFNLWWFEGKKWGLNSIVASPGTSFRSLKRNFERFNCMCSMSKRAPYTCVNRSNEMVFDSHLSRPVIITTHPNWRLISAARWMTATTLID